MLVKVPREKGKQATFMLSQSIIDEVDIRSAAVGLSKSAYVRLALLDYFRKEDNKQR